MDNILDDIMNKINIEVSEKDIHLFSDGTTEALVFSIKDKYLIKCSSKLELDVYNEFLSRYQTNYFQKLYYINYDLGYVCLSFIKGNKYSNCMDINCIINTLYDITSNYKTINYDGYGYLFEDHKTWKDFLEDEINYSISVLDNKIAEDIIKEAINNISNYKVNKYLLHGDFGTHNFIINDNKLYVIDPMGLVGDPLYDFYFSIFSNVDIFTKVDLKQLLNYFDRDINYKKSMMIITYFIRLCRTYKYERKNFNTYLEYFNKIICID